MKLVYLFIFAGLVSMVLGCSDDSGTSEPDGATDASADVTAYPDLGALPDLPQTAPCESEWKDAVGAQTTVSGGAVASTDKGSGVFETTIDATAGGMNNAHKNPFVYVSLTDGTRVDIDDVSAKDSTAWDLAFRRTVIRVNGGDSGAGQGAVAIITSAFDQVSSAPAAGSFKTDEFIDESCNVSRDPINNIMTAFNGGSMWYAYDSVTSKVTPKAVTYVVRTATGDHVKLVIDSYYDTSGASAHFTIRWSKL